MTLNPDPVSQLVSYPSMLEFRKHKYDREVKYLVRTDVGPLRLLKGMPTENPDPDTRGLLLGRL
jgi:hypothetical protein